MAVGYSVSEKPAVPFFTARDALILSNNEFGCQSERFGTHLPKTKCYIPGDLSSNNHTPKGLYVLVSYGNVG